MVIIDYDGLKERGIRYSRPHLWRLCTTGKFPKPIKLSSCRNAWLASDIDAWIESPLPSVIVQRLNSKFDRPHKGPGKGNES